VVHTSAFTHDTPVRMMSLALPGFGMCRSVHFEPFQCSTSAVNVQCACPDWQPRPKPAEPTASQSPEEMHDTAVREVFAAPRGLWIGSDDHLLPFHPSTTPDAMSP
jgi:hypothetical protein